MAACVASESLRNQAPLPFLLLLCRLPLYIKGIFYFSVVVIFFQSTLPVLLILFITNIL
jgi:hypothetical protein